MRYKRIIYLIPRSRFSLLKYVVVKIQLTSMKYLVLGCLNLPNFLKDKNKAEHAVQSYAAGTGAQGAKRHIL